MENITSYILGLVTLSALSSLITAFAPDNGVKKYLRFLTAVIVALTMLMPLRSVIFGLPSQLSSLTEGAYRHEIPESRLPDTSELVIGYTSDRLRCELESEIMTRFGVPSDVLITFEDDEGSIRLKSVTVALNADAAVYRSEIKSLVAERLGIIPETVTKDEEAQ